MDFWNYSLTLYGQPGVAEVCLSLHHRRSLNVNVLLLCCWLASRGKLLDPATLARAMAAIAAWHSGIVLPLRTLRQRLKDEFSSTGEPQVAAVREAVKACELSAERHEQRHLLAALGQGLKSVPRTRETALNNLLCYAPGEDAEVLRLVDAAFSDATAARRGRGA